MKKNILITTLLATSLLSSTITFAEESPNWNYVSAGYASMGLDDDEASLEFDGFIINGSATINNNFFVIADFSNISTSFYQADFDFFETSIGLGYKYAINATTDLFTIASYERLTFEVTSNNQSDDNSENGYALEAGARTMITDKVELLGSVKYLTFDSQSETLFNVEAFYKFTENFSAGVGYYVSSDRDTYSIQTRYSF